MTADLSATEIAARVAAGELSPVAVVESALARVAQLNPRLNALVTLNERALDDARALERRIAQGDPVGRWPGCRSGSRT